jgi:dephospho-CoA kinase
VIALGLTGNIGCGKSTVAAMLADMGAVVVDADQVVRELLSPGGAAEAAVLAAFPGARGTDGAIDRRALAAIVFADAARRRELERIVHPLVLERSEAEARDARARGAKLFVHEAALLFEAARDGGPDPRARFDALVVVTCDPAVQLERVAARARGDRDAALADARSRIAAQMPQDEKARLADFVVDNSGDLAETERQVRVVVSGLLARERTD